MYRVGSIHPNYGALNRFLSGNGVLFRDQCIARLRFRGVLIGFRLFNLKTALLTFKLAAATHELVVPTRELDECTYK